jgi:hypothetical protein
MGAAMAGRTQGILGATIGAMLLTLSDSGAAQQPATPLRPDQVRFRALYQAMVETDTSITTGSCTALAGTIEARLLAAGYPASAITRFAVPDHPKEGGLVVTLPGTSRTVKPMLLIGHLDVVVANPKDWTRDPYKMVEENGYFYGRGTADMKAMDAIWVDTMIRFKESGYRPKRTIKLALTCGEETSWAFNGMKWLAQNRPELIAAEFALNEGGGGRSDGKGNLAIANIHVGEKAAVNYRIEATNPGGHSSAPVRDNAIYELSDALGRLRAYDFPLQMSDTTRAYFRDRGRPDRQGCRNAAQHRQKLSFDAAHDLRRDAAGRWPCQQCAAAARGRQYQLPHLPRRVGRSGARDAGAGDRRSAHDGKAGRRSRARGRAPAARPQDRPARRTAAGALLSGRTARADDVDGRDRRHLSGSDRHPVLRPARPVRGPRR